MRAAFIHDHVFYKFKDDYYSYGKLTYSKLAGYLDYCDELTVIGRVKSIDFRPDDKFRANGDKISVYGLPNLASFKGVITRKEVKKRLDLLMADVDFVISRFPSEYGLMAESLCRSRNIPSLLEVVASASDCLWYRGDFIAKLYSPIIQYRVKKVISKAKYVIYVTSNYLQQEYPTQGQSIGVSDAVVNSGSSTFKKPPVGRKVRVGVIGNPSLKLKGIDTLIKSVIRLGRNDIQVSIVGGNLNSQAESQLSSLEFVEQVGYLSTKAELSDWFNSIDLYVQPSFTEGLPRSILEAMSHAIPVLGSNVGGIPELVRKDMTFCKGNYRQLSSLLDNVLSSSDIYIELSQHSLSLSSHYDSSILKKRKDFINQFISESV